MPDTTHAHDAHADRDELDAQLRLIARALVDPALPPPRLDEPGFGAVVARRDAARRRLTTAVAAAAAVVLVVAGVVAVASGGWSDNADGTDVSSGSDVDPSLAAPQRLVLNNWWGELPDGGEPVKLPLAGLDPHGRPRFLPDGALVVVGSNPPPGPLPADFDEMTDITYGLAVIEPGGDVAVERDIAPAGLVGVAGHEALLQRVVTSEPGQPRRIVAHDLATGAERTVFEETGDPADRSASSASAVIGDRLVTVGGAPMPSSGATGFVPPTPADATCTLRSVDLATGEVVESDIDLACDTVLDVQASPDGTQVAVAYEPPMVTVADPEQRLALVDVVTGRVADDRSLGNNVDCAGDGCEPGLRPVSYLGMAWSADTTLEVALLDLVAAPGWNFDEDGLTTDEMVVDEITVG